MIAEVHDMRLFQQLPVTKLTDHPSQIPVHIFNHSIVPGQIFGRPVPDLLQRRHILPEFNASSAPASHKFRRRNKWIVGRLNRDHRKKWAFPVSIQILKQKVRKGVGLIALQLLHHLALPHVPVYIGIPGTVVILISQPLFKTASPLFRDEMECRPALALVESIQMPFSQIKSLVTMFPEYTGNRRQLRIQRIFMARHTVVWIAACQHGTSKRAAQRHAGVRHFKVTAGAGQPVHVGR